MTQRQPGDRTGRRAALLGALGLALPAPARAQGRVHRLGVLAPGRFSIEGVRRWTLPELARLGFVEGRNLEVMLRSTDGDATPLPALAAELGAARLDVAIAVTNPVARLLRAADPRLPIVMGFAGNPALLAVHAAEVGLLLLCDWRPECFELVVNIAAATRLGFDIPPLLLARADEVLR